MVDYDEGSNCKNIKKNVLNTFFGVHLNYFTASTIFETIFSKKVIDFRKSRTNLKD